MNGRRSDPLRMGLRRGRDHMMFTMSARRRCQRKRSEMTQKATDAAQTKAIEIVLRGALHAVGRQASGWLRCTALQPAAGSSTA